jgi:hypothetical protein
MFDCKIIDMHTYWCGEYERLNSFFHTVGISHLLSCPHTHQQNGAAERKHCHIVEIGLSLLANASMPLKYWDQVFLTATHLINHTPTKLLAYDMPLHRLLGARPNYSTLHVFGCTCWPNLCPYNTNKLQFRSIYGAFIGYNNLHKGYKCLDITSDHVYVSRDIVFDESVFPFAQLHPMVGACYTSNAFLLPDPIPRASSTLPLNNAHTNACLSAATLQSSELMQPQRIRAPSSAADPGTDPGVATLPDLVAATDPTRADIGATPMAPIGGPSSAATFVASMPPRCSAPSADAPSAYAS